MVTFESLKKELLEIVNKTLDRCEKQWENTLGQDELLKKAMREAFAARTNIPGHPYLDENQYKSDQFVAFMLDMRDSTKHLRQAISHRIARVSLMQRVFYEVSALLPAMAKVINEYNGAVTEYLGDGLLALFQLPKEKKAQELVLYNVLDAARTCMDALHQVVNVVLKTRYNLPPLQIGIGLAFSDAIISHFGLSPDTQVKVIGQCIYFASQCSKGRNQIIVHEWLENIWPTSKEGKLRFIPKQFSDFKGYIIEQDSSKGVTISV